VVAERRGESVLSSGQPPVIVLVVVLVLVLVLDFFRRVLLGVHF
jgi:hypothetical protein